MKDTNGFLELNDEELKHVRGGNGSEYKPRGCYMANINDTPTVSPRDCKHCSSYYRTCKNPDKRIF